MMLARAVCIDDWGGSRICLIKFKFNACSSHKPANNFNAQSRHESLHICRARKSTMLLATTIKFNVRFISLFLVHTHKNVYISIYPKNPSPAASMRSTSIEHDFPEAAKSLIDLSFSQQAEGRPHVCGFLSVRQEHFARKCKHACLHGFGADNRSRVFLLRSSTSRLV